MSFKCRILGRTSCTILKKAKTPFPSYSTSNIIDRATSEYLSPDLINKCACKETVTSDWCDQKVD